MKTLTNSETYRKPHHNSSPAYYLCHSSVFSTGSPLIDRGKVGLHRYVITTKILNHQRIYRKHWFNFISYQKIFISWHSPIKSLKRVVVGCGVIAQIYEEIWAAYQQLVFRIIYSKLLLEN